MNELLTKVLEGARWSGALAPPFVHDLTTLQNPGLDRMGGRDPVAGRPRPRVVAGAQGSNSIHRGTMEFTLEWG